jgi:hypothetical protein
MMHFLIYVLLGLLTTSHSGTAQNIPSATSVMACRVTLPKGGGTAVDGVEPGFHGTKELSVSIADPDGTVVFKPGGAGFVLPDGSLSMKFGWQRGVRGLLTIDGRRLDAAAPPLRASIPAGYGDIGFQATGLIFPTPGCWEVTGHVGNSSITFTTRVVKIGEGPGRKARGGH